MSIILSSQLSSSSSGVLGDFVSSLSNSFGLPGFSQPGYTNEVSNNMGELTNRMNDVLNRLMGGSQNSFDPNYVDSGRQTVIGGGIQGGKVPPLEEANVRQVYSQTPKASVLIKKRAFSSLRSLYNPAYMDSAEAWLIRATKRLVARKCDIIADYERISKIERLLNGGIDPGAILSSYISDAMQEFGKEQNFVSSVEFERIIGLRQPVRTTTYFPDDSSVYEKFGYGTGVFEITMISSLNTSLGLDGSSSCSFTIEDPYRLLFITETDIEMALRDTILSSTVNELNSAASSALSNAQSVDEILSRYRIQRNVSPITFSIAVGGSKISAIVDAIGMEIGPANLDDIPEPHNLNDSEKSLFTSVYTGLTLYSEAMNKNVLGGANLKSASKSIEEQLKYARNKMRLFYLGKSIIQPMDTVNVFIDGGTRKSGEGENVEDITIHEQPLNAFIRGLNSKGSGVDIDEDLLRWEYDRYNNSIQKDGLTFEDFKHLRTVSYSTENATHVFGGLINTVNDKFDSGSGSYTLSVSGESNMKWLSISRYNASPSLTQMEGLVYDPLTPFQYELDKATGLPTGKPKLSAENRERIGGECRLYFNSGPKTGKEVETEDDLKQDVRRIGGNLISIYHHPPGLVYRWKEGIMTSVYNQYITDPLDNTLTNMGQVRRDIGLFAQNTPFGGMDSANILSILITGKPYNYSSFVESAMNSTTFSVNSTLNSGKDYFQSLIRNLKSEIEVNGNFIPFKSIQVEQDELARTIALQQRLSGKSSELQKLRNEEAKLLDQIANYPGGIQNNQLAAVFNKKLQNVRERVTTLETDFSSLAKKGQDLNENVIQVAGNDITFDLVDNKKIKLFGDRLLFATQRRKEDVATNIDKNYFIVSDEYDKDYDIQAFVLKLMQQNFELFKGSWQSVLTMCKNVAETLNFELFCSTQGHIVFRPPQYNRTPATILNSMLSLAYAGGIKLFPDFLTHLFASKEKALINEIVILEWKIRQQAALLGKTTIEDVTEFIYGMTGEQALFITNNEGQIEKAANGVAANTQEEKQILRNLVKNANYQTQLKSSENNKLIGPFSAVAQQNLYKDLTKDAGSLGDVVLNTSGNLSDFSAYDEASKAIATLTGQQRRSQPEYDSIKVGAIVNGKKTPSTDVNRIITEISSLVSIRSKLLLSLDKALEQNIEILSLGSDGETKISQQRIFEGDYLPKSLSNKLIEDDTKNTLGNLSGERFTIKDEHIISADFSEQPPEFTSIAVKGTTPFVGDSGGIAGIKDLMALGTDFDMWRQYGWRNERDVDKPFLSDAQLQCAPYAIMLLSRQRKNIITGNITVFGNEFYQLGDVVYVTHRQLLYYVDKIQHSFSYDGRFQTSLSLKYGHPPGEYIPTPLDVIGKQMVNRANSHTGYRIRRDLPRFNTLLGIVIFNEESEDILKGKYSKDNFKNLIKSVQIAKSEIDSTDSLNSARIYCITFFGDEDLQNTRAQNVANWFENPERPSVGANDEGNNNFVSSVMNSLDGSLQNFKIDPKFIEVKRLNQCLPPEDKLKKSEQDLLSQGISASQEAIAVDGTLGNVVEIRLVQPPVGGWKDE